MKYLLIIIVMCLFLESNGCGNSKRNDTYDELIQKSTDKSFKAIGLGIMGSSLLVLGVAGIKHRAHEHFLSGLGMSLSLIYGTFLSAGSIASASESIRAYRMASQIRQKRLREIT